MRKTGVTKKSSALPLVRSYAARVTHRSGMRARFVLEAGDAGVGALGARVGGLVHVDSDFESLSAVVYALPGGGRLDVTLKAPIDPTTTRVHLRPSLLAAALGSARMDG